MDREGSNISWVWGFKISVLTVAYNNMSVLWWMNPLEMDIRQLNGCKPIKWEGAFNFVIDYDVQCAEMGGMYTV